MRIKSWLASILAAAMLIAPIALVPHAPSFAQDSGGDDDDDDDEDDGGDDGDGDVDDPDDGDSGDDGDAGDDGDVGDDGDADGGDDGGDDDGGAGDGDDGGTGGDDDGGDDDGGTGGDDDGGDDGGGTGGGDDGNDDGGTGDDDDAGDDGGTGSGDETGGGDDDGQWDVSEAETEDTRAQLDEADAIETDREGFRYRRGEFVALDLTAQDLSQLRESGFELVESEQLVNLTGTVFLLRSPARLTDEDALDAIEAVAEPDGFGFNHLFDSSSVRTTKAKRREVPERRACGCDIGLIDTGVANTLPMFKHVTVVQKAFNGKQAEARLHGTAVAHLMAGTQRHETRATRIYVADIFSGPRANAGSSYALIKALDWLAARGAPVINVSLSGPRNPAVAGAVARIAKRGHIVVAAAGNDGPAAPPVFPAAYDDVVAVTAVDGANRVYRYANRGRHVDFSARGVAVPAIDAKGAVRDATGTSFAAPVIAARLASALRTPSVAESDKVIRNLERQARDLGAPGRDPIYGAGLIEGGE